MEISHAQRPYPQRPYPQRTYICIDLKSYYASVECVYRGLDPLKANLLVADPSRSDQTICLAVSPSLKAMGVPGRPRLFEARQAIRLYEAQHHTKVQYIIAVPRMAEYERISAQIYGIYLRYVAPEDVHVYSIDECFIDCSGYLHMYLEEAERSGMDPAHAMAMTMIRDVLRETGITATVGIGTNLYLAKVAMDIVAKKRPADKDGVRIAELSEDSYKYLLWDHRPLTDFWQIGPGKARRLYRDCMFTMGDIARRTQWDEEYFYRTFGIDGEILVDDMFAKNLVTKGCTRWVSYDHKSLEACPGYEGPVALDFYGRLHPKHSGGTVRLKTLTNDLQQISEPLVRQFDEKTDHRLLYRKLGVCAMNVAEDTGMYQMNMFVDYDALERDRRLMAAMLEVRRRYGANAVFKGMNMLEGATMLERNQQIGGHKA